MPDQESLALIRKGISAAKSGSKREAYPLLRRATELDPGNALGWLWLAGVAPSSDEAAACLRRALSIDPGNRLAQDGLAQIESREADLVDATVGEDQQPAALEPCPFCRRPQPEAALRCPACKGLLTFQSLDSFFDETDCERDIVGEAIALAQSREAIEPTVAGQRLLALAHLNLGDLDAAVRHLRAAVGLDGGDVESGQVLELLLDRAATPASERELNSRKRILIVDDSPTVRKLVTITLERHGHEVVFAEDGMAALARINEGLPDLVLLDINMPRMDGFQLCRTIKSSPATRHIPVVMLTGRDGLTDKVRARMVGCEEFLSKPFEPAELNRLVDRHSKRRSGREARPGGDRGHGR